MAQQTTSNIKNDAIDVVICGGGIIGVCTAYYLAQRENVTSITIIERYMIAGCASGKAGGFLALDWCDNGWLEPLARKSFQLHSELGEKYGHKYFYRRCAAYSINSKYSQIPIKSKHTANYNELHWLDCKILQKKVLGSKSTNAQLNPRMFCETLIDLVKNKVNIIYGIVTGMLFDKTDKTKVIGVEYVPNQSKTNTNNNNKQKKENLIINCNFVVIALGPWSTQCYQWFPKCKNLTKISSYKYNSIVVQPDYSTNKQEKKDIDNQLEIKKDIDKHAYELKSEPEEKSYNKMFLHSKNDITDTHNNENEMKQNDVVNITNENMAVKAVNNLEGAIYLKHKCKNGKNINIEIYPRSDGSVYSCGPAKRIALPNDPSNIKGDKYTQNIHNALKEISFKYLLQSKLMIKQACYLPQSEDNAPFIGQITNYKNAFIGTAHRCWGILNATATALILCELIVDGKVNSFSKDALERWCPSRS